MVPAPPPADTLCHPPALLLELSFVQMTVISNYRRPYRRRSRRPYMDGGIPSSVRTTVPSCMIYIYIYIIYIYIYNIYIYTRKMVPLSVRTMVPSSVWTTVPSSARTTVPSSTQTTINSASVRTTELARFARRTLVMFLLLSLQKRAQMGQVRPLGGSHWLPRAHLVCRAALSWPLRSW